MMNYRRFFGFALMMSVWGIGSGGCLCGVDPAGCDGTAVPLSFEGSISGSAKTSSATDAQAADAASARAKGLGASQGQIGAGAVGWFEDLNGFRLTNGDGQAYPEFAINTDGSFSMAGLPVGIDFVLAVDIDGDGKADMHTLINIPKDATSNTGALADVVADPLSTMVLAKLRRIALSRGIELGRIGISPSGLVYRVRDAFEHLFEETGIEESVLMSRLANLSDEEMAALFDAVIPPLARRAMEMADGNIQLVLASEIAGVVRAAAIILLQGGFMIADDPGGIDLSFLGAMPDITSMTFDEFDALMRNTQGPAAASVVPRPEPQAFPMPTIYMNQLGEVDRNFSNNEDEQSARGVPRGPMFGEHVLSEMARFYLEGKTVSLGDLHRILVDLELGMGARLTYGKWNGPDQPPTEVFQSVDGTGIELNLQDVFRQLEEMHLGNPDPELFEQQENQVRQLLTNALKDTAEPSFEKLFSGVLMDHVGGFREFANRIRNARAHLPFSRSGPARFFVVADSDSFQNANARAVTVNVETDERGRVTKVTYDPAGTGKFYLGFGPMTDAGMRVDLINLRTGKPLHDKHGEPQMLELSDSNVFEDIGGQSFIDAFSETGSHYPGGPALKVPNHDFDPALPPDPETNPPAFETWVLLDKHGPGGEPVRVDYASNVATYSAAGRYYLMFDEKTDLEGKFALITETGEVLEATPGDWNTRVLVRAVDVVGITLAPETFRHIFGIEVANAGYDPSGAPYYDDINGNGTQDSGEPSFDWRQQLFDPADWTSTWVEKYYRRADNNGFPQPQDIDWSSPTPKLLSGVALVPRDIQPRENAFRFGRPNLTINLLSAFSPPEFFNGTHALNAETRVNPFTAVAFVSLAFDSIHNIVGKVDWDGPGGMPEHEELIEAHIFIMPIGDPTQLITKGFKQLAQ